MGLEAAGVAVGGNWESEDRGSAILDFGAIAPGGAV